MYVCMYVCMHECMYVCMYVCMHVCTSVFTCISILFQNVIPPHILLLTSTFTGKFKQELSSAHEDHPRDQHKHKNVVNFPQQAKEVDHISPASQPSTHTQISAGRTAAEVHKHVATSACKKASTALFEEAEAGMCNRALAPTAPAPSYAALFTRERIGARLAGVRLRAR